MSGKKPNCSSRRYRENKKAKTKEVSFLFTIQNKVLFIALCRGRTSAPGEQGNQKTTVSSQARL